MELIKLNELKELMAPKNLKNSRIVDGVYGLVEWKEEIFGSDGLFEIDENYKANGSDGLEIVELTELHGLMSWKLWENGINHIDRSDETNGIDEVDRFNRAVWTRR